MQENVNVDLIEIQNMQFSPYKQQHEKEITKWHLSLKQISDVLDEMQKMQAMWVRLIPLFQQEDTVK